MIDEYTGKKIVSPLDFKKCIDQALSDNSTMEPIVMDGAIVFTQEQIDQRRLELEELKALL